MGNAAHHTYSDSLLSTLNRGFCSTKLPAKHHMHVGNDITVMQLNIMLRQQCHNAATMALTAALCP
jgi:hypothetical protein